MDQLEKKNAAGLNSTTIQTDVAAEQQLPTT